MLCKFVDVQVPDFVYGWQSSRSKCNKGLSNVYIWILQPGNRSLFLSIPSLSMMLWAGWRWTCPAARGSPYRLLQHLLGRSLPRRCCSCTVHNPCTRAAAWPTGSWHVSLFSFTRTFILVLQALLPGWTLARPQVPLLLPLHLHHKIRCRLSLLKACITTTSAPSLAFQEPVIWLTQAM